MDAKAGPPNPIPDLDLNLPPLGSERRGLAVSLALC
jgi:hypothetical protein